MIVQVALKTTNIFDVAARVAEVFEIRNWAEELVGGDKEMFEFTYSASSGKLNVWFENEEHATLFALRWA